MIRIWNGLYECKLWGSSFAKKHAHAHVHTNMYTQTHAHQRTHTHTHAHTHAHMHTHTHAHTHVRHAHHWFDGLSCSVCLWKILCYVVEWDHAKAQRAGYVFKESGLPWSQSDTSPIIFPWDLCYVKLRIWWCTFWYRPRDQPYKYSTWKQSICYYVAGEFLFR